MENASNKYQIFISIKIGKRYVSSSLNFLKENFKDYSNIWLL